MKLPDVGYKRAVLIAGAVGVVSAFAYVYVKRSRGRRAQVKREPVNGSGTAYVNQDIGPDEFFQDAVDFVSKHGDNLPNQAKLQLAGCVVS